MTANEPEKAHTSPTFRQTLFRVMAVQVISLLLLWALQARYNG
jgi:hypothetical protein